MDIHGNRITKENKEDVANVVIPLWYWLMIVDYVEGTETAVQSLTTSLE